jgi:PIN domain nuclease of toxin-antitoxin system
VTLLLDTHTLLWALRGEPMTDESVARITDPEEQVWVSAATVWEASIKAAIGKLYLDGSLIDAASQKDFRLLAITAEHGEAAGRLPPHHRDPFDRMLIAQARLQGLTIVTRDRAFEPYDVTVLTC